MLGPHKYVPKVQEKVDKKQKSKPETTEKSQMKDANPKPTPKIAKETATPSAPKE